MTGMAGLDAQKALAWIAPRLDKKRCAGLEGETEALTARLIEAQVDYLRQCGALDADGDTGEGEYDEDDALEALLDAVSGGASEARALRLAVLIDDFLPLFDKYLRANGLLCG